MRLVALGAAALLAAPHLASAQAAPVGRSRYLLSPSAFLLAPGEKALSQSELVVTSLAAGLAEHLTVTLGSALPVAVFVPNAVVELRTGFSASERVHLALQIVSAQLYGPVFPPTTGRPRGQLWGAAAVTLTVGTPDRNVSLSAGTPRAWSSDGTLRDPGLLIAGVAGAWRLSPRLSLILDAAWQPLGARAYATGGAALRIDRALGGRWSLDVGVLKPPGPNEGVGPWLDVTLPL